MATNQNFEQELISMKRELLELKTAQQLSPRIRAYTGSFTLAEIGADEDTIGVVKITFEDGDGDIMSEYISDVSIWPAIPQGNEQTINCQTFIGSSLLNAPIFILSTRPIASIELVA